jgi:hypothetical protein
MVLIRPSVKTEIIVQGQDRDGIGKHTRLMS